MKKGIALLITLMFIIAITLSIGVGLSYTKRAKNSLSDENFLFQSDILLNDVLNLLKKSKDLQLVAKDKSGRAFNIFLAQSSFIPFESSGVSVTIEIKSARSKFNPSTLIKPNSKKIDLPRVNLLREYFARKQLNNTYVDILLDGLGGVKNNLSYNSTIFNKKNTLFRDYIVSKKHLDVFNEFYKNSFYDDSLSRINLENLFYFAKDTKGAYAIDINHATQEVWELMLNANASRAKELVMGAGYYTKKNISSILSKDELNMLSNFKISYTPQLFLDVQVEITQNNSSAKIAFEYDIKKTIGYNFAYEI